MEVGEQKKEKEKEKGENSRKQKQGGDLPVIRLSKVW